MEKINLQKIRKIKGFTLKELSQKIGCSRSLLCYIEKGKRVPGFIIAEKLSKELGISLFDLRPDLRELVKRQIK